MAATAVLLMALSTVAPRAKVEHHSVLPYDGVTKTTIEGTVVRVLWQNPHTLIVVSVGDHRWTIESEGSLILQRLGWTSDSLKAGDKVTVTGARAKDGRRLMRCTTISLRLRSGQGPGDQQLHCFSPSS